MGCIFALVRAGAASVLGVVVFVGFLLFLILNNFSDKLLSADFYKYTLAGQDTYNRIYSEVLVDEQLLDRTEEFLGDVQVVSHQEIVDLLREILPPAYVQAQVEAVIDRTIDYVNEDVDVLEAFIDLTVPLRNVKPVMFAHIDGRIDELQDEDPGISRCSTTAVTELAGRYVEKFNSLATGKVPTTVPSLKTLDPACRRLLFAAAFDLMLASSNLDPEINRLLIAGRERLRVPFEAGDTLGMLKVSARLLTEPLMDNAIDDLRANLSPNDRFDLIHQIAVWNPDRSEAQIREDLDDGRKWITRARNFGNRTTLLMVIVGSVLMGMVHFPRLSSMLRWPGITLLLTGVVFFVVGKVLENEVPNRLTVVVETGADKVTNVPSSVTDLGGDILISFGSQVTNGFAGPSLTLLIIGAVLFGASFLSFAIKRFIPFVK